MAISLPEPSYVYFDPASQGKIEHAGPLIAALSLDNSSQPALSDLPCACVASAGAIVTTAATDSPERLIADRRG